MPAPGKLGVTGTPRTYKPTHSAVATKNGSSTATPGTSSGISLIDETLSVGGQLLSTTDQYFGTPNWEITGGTLTMNGEPAVYPDFRRPTILLTPGATEVTLKLPVGVYSTIPRAGSVGIASMSWTSNDVPAPFSPTTADFYFSSNGTSWTPVIEGLVSADGGQFDVFSSSGPSCALAFNPRTGKWIQTNAVNHVLSTPAHSISYSTDSQNWNYATFGPPAGPFFLGHGVGPQVSSLAVGPSVDVASLWWFQADPAVDSYFFIGYSTDDVNWTSIDLAGLDGTDLPFLSVVWDSTHSRFFALSQGQNFYTSSDGIHWSQTGVTPPDGLSGVWYVNGQLFGAGGGSLFIIYYSTDGGSTWTAGNVGGWNATVGGVTDIAYNGSYYLASLVSILGSPGSPSPYQLGYSSDGVNWTIHDTPFSSVNPALWSVAWSPVLSEWLAVGIDAWFTSHDSVNWTSQIPTYINPGQSFVGFQAVWSSTLNEWGVAAIGVVSFEAEATVELLAATPGETVLGSEAPSVFNSATSGVIALPSDTSSVGMVITMQHTTGTPFLKGETITLSSATLTASSMTMIYGTWPPLPVKPDQDIMFVGKLIGPESFLFTGRNGPSDDGSDLENVSLQMQAQGANSNQLLTVGIGPSSSPYSFGPQNYRTPDGVQLPGYGTPSFWAGDTPPFGPVFSFNIMIKPSMWNDSNDLLLGVQEAIITDFVGNQFTIPVIQTVMAQVPPDEPGWTMQTMYTTIPFSLAQHNSFIVGSQDGRYIFGNMDVPRDGSELLPPYDTPPVGVSDTLARLDLTTGGIEAWPPSSILAQLGIQVSGLIDDVDSAGNIYVSAGNSELGIGEWKITPDGSMSLVASSAVMTQINGFNEGITADKYGRLYAWFIDDAAGLNIFRFDPNDQSIATWKLDTRTNFPAPGINNSGFNDNHGWDAWIISPDGTKFYFTLGAPGPDSVNTALYGDNIHCWVEIDLKESGHASARMFPIQALVSSFESGTSQGYFRPIPCPDGSFLYSNETFLENLAGFPGITFSDIGWFLHVYPQGNPTTATRIGGTWDYFGNPPPQAITGNFSDGPLGLSRSRENDWLIGSDGTGNVVWFVDRTDGLETRGFRPNAVRRLFRSSPIAAPVLGNGLNRTHRS